MASEFVSINNLKENILEFDLSVEGVNTDSVDAKFVIRSNDMDLAFACKKGDGNKWSVKLPPLPMLERTSYPFHFSVIAEGYHFQPLKGSLNVVGSTEVYVANTKNTKLASPANTEVVKEKQAEIKVLKAEPTKSREKPIEQVARDLMESAKHTVKPAPAETKVEKKVVVESLLPKIAIEEKKESATAANDIKARKVLEDMGFKPKKAKKNSRFSLKN